MTTGRIAVPLALLGLSLEQWSAVGNVALTFGLLVFAGMQWWVSRQADRRQARERLADEAAQHAEQLREQDLAFQTVWAEHFRIWALAKQWEKGDLIAMSVYGLLRPDDLLPRDWATLTQMLGKLGPEAAFLGAVGVTWAHDMARLVAEFNTMVESHVDRPAGETKIEILRGVYLPELEGHIEAIRNGVSQAALIIWDALRHSGAADRQRTMNFRDDLDSQIARDAVAEIGQRAKAHQASTKESD